MVINTRFYYGGLNACKLPLLLSKGYLLRLVIHLRLMTYLRLVIHLRLMTYLRLMIFLRLVRFLVLMRATFMC